MDETIKTLLAQLEKTQESIRDCQNKLTMSVMGSFVMIVLIILIIFKGKGVFSKDKIVIGDVKDKEDLHSEVVELKKLVAKQEQIIEKLTSK